MKQQKTDGEMLLALDPPPWVIEVNGMLATVHGTPETMETWQVRWNVPRQSLSYADQARRSFKLGSYLRLRRDIVLRGQHQPWTEHAREQRLLVGLPR